MKHGARRHAACIVAPQAAPRARAHQRGAALLTAMVIVTLVATLAGAMVWQQWRAVQVEAAERARTQAQWILLGAIDWARLILREDRKTGTVDHLGEPWALPLAEAKLSTFLAADRENTEDAPDAFLSGGIVDAQSRYNLRNVATAALNPKEEERTVANLLELLGVRPEVAPALVLALRQAAPPTAASDPQNDQQGNPQPIVETPRSSDPPLLPERIDQLAWLGLDPETLRRIAPFVTMLPEATPVNANTASKEVLAAVIGVDLASADRLVQARQSRPFETVAAIAPLPGTTKASDKRLAVGSNYFEIRGRLRLQDRVVEERALVVRRDNEITSLQRERVTALDSVTQ